MITTVLFDLDDTLYDEVDFCRSGYRAVAAFLSGVPNLTASPSAEEIFAAFWREFEKGNRDKVFDSALAALGVAYEADTIDHLVRIYREHRPDITLPTESREILDALQGQYALGLLTDGFLPTQRLKVEALGIGHYFKHICYTEELGREAWKPSTKGFKYLLKKFRAKATDCVYVADNAAKDFIGPNALGMATIQLIRPNRVFRAAPSGPEAEPGQIIASLSQLPAALKRLGGK
ncbi:MAG TPA: HAD family hydrolase [Anaerohalosphaeraceae bacterium]|jgi:putative hydrolase of the HAD superfamily|nr:HAD family hydrolase [Anaerohalosphaeraceae bacterium]HRT49116.1 HAD family hydrolase [Anaerohalosphaeraceae bacterium]HRT85631.1 HAD family hydrolase [Anaerohalosphaeraceae bacterium]